MRSRTAFPAAGLFLLFLAAPALAQRTDVIVLINGDRITGEIKSYASGRLVVDTEGSGDASMKWNKILSITSSKEFEIETTDGLYHYGTLAPSDPPGKLDIVSAERTDTIEFLAMVRITPIYQTFWRRFQGSLDFGFTYTQANNFVQFNLNADATFRRPTFQMSMSISTFFSSQQGVTSSQRANFGAAYQKFLKDRWLLIGFGGLDRNLDLGLDLRSTLGVGYGRDVIQTNQTTLTAILGISGQHEDPVSGTPSYEAAAVIAATYSMFTYDFPKITVTGSVQVIPYLTDFGRVRIEFSGAVKREIIHDFYLSLSIFDSFDSRDPSTQQSKNDWGPVLSVGWNF
jgi:hypothetical protein